MLFQHWSFICTIEHILNSCISNIWVRFRWLWFVTCYLKFHLWQSLQQKLFTKPSVTLMKIMISIKIIGNTKLGKTIHILNRLKLQKSSKRGHHGSLISQWHSENPFQTDALEIIDLTNTRSQSPIRKQPFSSPLKKRKHIHWGNTQTQAVT